MNKSGSRRNFIKGAVAGIAGILISLRGATPVEATSRQVPRKLKHIVDMSDPDRIDDTRAVIAEARPRRGTTELWWCRSQDSAVLRWNLIEVGRSPDGDGMVNWDIAYWRESEL
jgi:hypothetical protein